MAAAQTQIRVCQALQELPPAKQLIKVPGAGDTNKPSRTVYRKRVRTMHVHACILYIYSYWVSYFKLAVAMYI